MSANSGLQVSRLSLILVTLSVLVLHEAIPGTKDLSRALCGSVMNAAQSYEALPEFC